MKCPKCNEEMVEGEFQTPGRYNFSGRYGAWVRPVEVRSFMDGFLMRDDHRVHLIDQQARVCHHCGAVVLFIEDASAFRPKTGKEAPQSTAAEGDNDTRQS